MAGQHDRQLGRIEALQHIVAHCIADDDSLLTSTNPLAILTHWLQSQDRAPIYGTNHHRDTWSRLLAGYRDFGDKPLPDNFPKSGRRKIGQVDVDFGVPYPPPEHPAFTFIDIYAGIGGFRLALQELGGKCEFSCEWDRSAKETYYRNFGEIPFGDIREFTGTDVPDAVIEKCIPPHDILAAGFPCQPFSRAGVSARSSLGQQHGFSCEIQGTLFFDLVRIAKARRPKVLLLENVKNLKSHDGGRTFAKIKETIEQDLGYSFSAEIINASSLVPQKRERCFMVCFRDKAKQFKFPLLMKAPRPLSSILEPNPPARYTISDRLWEGHQNRTQRNLARGAGFTAYEADLSKPAHTLVARYGKDGKECLIPQKGKNPRKLTPRECARLQGFPENFVLPASDAAAYRQFGNSVPVPVVAKIAEAVLAELTKNK
jgi:DNA (cytosine-5)-methyltransferase 1